MRVPYSWIASFLKDAPPADIAAAILSRQGLLVEGQEQIGADLSAVLVVEVTALRPLTDHLQVAELRQGGAVATVVSGAQNLRLGGVYAWAPAGTILPGNRPIAVATFGGQQSEGMLLSAAEAGLGPEADRLLELPLEAVGKTLTSACGLPDTLFEIDLTPNLAAFCQHVVGVAAELQAGLGQRPQIAEPRLSAGAARQAATVSPKELAPTYLLARLTGPAGLMAPLWLRRRLWDSGLRSHDLYVDVTNYIALEWGQPMHAFDAAAIRGPIEVRLARAGERLETLDQVKRELGPDDIVIADQEGVLNIAGILGGKRTAVTEASTDIVLEVAAFDPRRIRRTRRRLGLGTDAALRFERGVDRSRSQAALAQALAILGAAGAGEAELICSHHLPLPPERHLSVRPDRVSALLGYPLRPTEITEGLQRLGFGCEAAGHDLLVTVPGRRPDVADEADVAEEVGRLFGYDRIPETILESAQVGDAGANWQLTQELRRSLLGLGLSEHVGHSLLSAEEVAPFGAAVEIANPLTVAETYLRPALSPSLLQALSLNVAHQVSDLRLFEVGRVFLPAGAGVKEQDRLGGVLSGSPRPSWTGRKRQADVFTAKGLLAALFASLHETVDLSATASHPFLHPHRQLSVQLNGQAIGYLGELHPTLVPDRLHQPVVLWEVELEPLIGRRQVTSARMPSRQPTVQRDLAVVVAEETSYAEVERAISNAGASWLEDVALFDLYRGQQIGVGKKSFALRLTFTDPGRTLTDAEVDRDSAVLEAALHEIGGDLRRQ